MGAKIEIGERPESAKRVVLVGHGLNNSGLVLDELAKIFDSGDCQFVKLTFAGHERGVPDPECDWGEVWVGEMGEAIGVADSVARGARLPLVFAGFSLACVVFLHANAKQNVRWYRVIFIGPPLGMSVRFRVLRHLKSWFVQKVPSLNKVGFRVHKYLALSKYLGLFDLIEKLNRVPARSIPVDGMVMVDPKDEVVSLPLIKKWLGHNCPSWRLEKIPGDPRQGVIHHLPFIESNAGPVTVGALRDRVRGFVD